MIAPLILTKSICIATLTGTAKLDSKHIRLFFKNAMMHFHLGPIWHFVDVFRVDTLPTMDAKELI
jgi:hypothetical protein